MTITIQFLFNEISQLSAVSKTNHRTIISTVFNNLNNKKANMSRGKRHCRQFIPFRNFKRDKCGKVGHIRSVCLSLVGHSSNDSQLSSDVQSLNLEGIHSHRHEHTTRAFLVNCSMEHSFVIDTGNVDSFIYCSIFKHLIPRSNCIPKLFPPKISLAIVFLFRIVWIGSVMPQRGGWQKLLGSTSTINHNRTKCPP